MAPPVAEPQGRSPQERAVGRDGDAGALAPTSGRICRTGLAESGGAQLVLIQSDFDIFGGTMGAVAGGKIVRFFRRATDRDQAERGARRVRDQVLT